MDGWVNGEEAAAVGQATALSERLAAEGGVARVEGERRVPAVDVLGQIEVGAIVIGVRHGAL